VQNLAGGTSATRAGAVEAASDALVVAAMDRGREEYRVHVADTLIVVVPGLTEQGDVDLIDLAAALPSFGLVRQYAVPRGAGGGSRFAGDH
jgi:hypothetical protein